MTAKKGNLRNTQGGGDVRCTQQSQKELVSFDIDCLFIWEVGKECGLQWIVKRKYVIDVGFEDKRRFEVIDGWTEVLLYLVVMGGKCEGCEGG